MMRLLIWLKTKTRGQLVGQDEFGNRYYESDTQSRLFRKKDRWVVYNGKIEPSKIPGLWFNWMHYQSNQIPNKYKPMKWERLHQQNFTGGTQTYPQAEQRTDFKLIIKPAACYEPWKPDFKT